MTVATISRVTGLSGRLDDDGDPGETWTAIAPEDADDVPLTVVGNDELKYNWEPESPDRADSRFDALVPRDRHY